LRKLSIRRLLEGESSFDWSSQDVDDWLAAGGWNSGKNRRGDSGVAQPAGPLGKGLFREPQLGEVGPDTDLLVWALAESYRLPLARIFCEELFANSARERGPLADRLAGNGTVRWIGALAARLCPFGATADRRQEQQSTQQDSELVHRNADRLRRAAHAEPLRISLA
jgi:hypothetical protein